MKLTNHIRSGIKASLNRSNRGFSLIAIMMIALLVGLIMAGTGAALISYYRTNTTDEMAELQTATIAESTANYVLAQLCQPESRTDFDVSVTEPVKIFAITSAEIGLSPSVAKNVSSIKVLLRNVAPAELKMQSNEDPKNFFPIAYDPKIDPDPTKSNYSSVFDQNYWRTMTVLVQYGSNGSNDQDQAKLKPYIKGIQIALKPTAKFAPPGSGDSSDKSFFNSAAYGRTSVSLNEGASSEAFDGSGPRLSPTNEHIEGDISAGSQIILKNGTEIGGKAQFSSLTSNSISADINSQINERIQHAADSLDVNGAPYLPPNDIATPTVLNQNNSSGVGKVEQTALPVDDIPSLAAPDQTPSLSADTSNPSGSYVIDQSQVNTVNLNNLPNTVRIFIESSDTALDPITFTQSLGKEGNPNNLEIWYNGQRDLNFNGTNVSALVYAPYAKVTVGKSTSPITTFSGSIVGREVVINKGSKIKFDTRSKNFTGSDVGYNRNNFKFYQTSGLNSLRWQVHTVKDLNRAEFLSESAVTP